MSQISREDAKKIVSIEHPDRIISSSQELNDGYAFFVKIQNMTPKQEQYWNEAYYVDNNGIISPFDLVYNMDLIMDNENTTIYYE